MWTAQDSKSHQPEEIIAAINRGDKLVRLDAGLSGNSDLLIMAQDETLESIRTDILHWHNQDAIDPEDHENPFESGTNRWSLRVLEDDEVEEIIEDWNENKMT